MIAPMAVPRGGEPSHRARWGVGTTGWAPRAARSFPPVRKPFRAPPEQRRTRRIAARPPPSSTADRGPRTAEQNLADRGPRAPPEQYRARRIVARAASRMLFG